jgi:hypothetical protein
MREVMLMVGPSGREVVDRRASQPRGEGPVGSNLAAATKEEKRSHARDASTTPQTSREVEECERMVP